MLVHAPERVRALALMDGVYGREWAMDAVASIESWDAAHGRWVLVWQTQCYMDLPHRLIIVRREHAAILSAILHYPDRWPPGTAVMLDRRAPERRSSIDRRDAERRRPARRHVADAGLHRRARGRAARRGRSARRPSRDVGLLTS